VATAEVGLLKQYRGEQQRFQMVQSQLHQPRRKRAEIERSEPAEARDQRLGSRPKQSRLAEKCLAARIGLPSLSKAGGLVVIALGEMKDRTGRTWEATLSRPSDERRSLRWEWRRRRRRRKERRARRCSLTPKSKQRKKKTKKKNIATQWERAVRQRQRRRVGGGRTKEEEEEEGESAKASNKLRW
jgi:hypothetical protein